MRRIMAVALAVLMLIGATAMAEGAGRTAAIFSMDNVTVELGGQTNRLDGASASLTLADIDGAASFLCEVDGDDEPLLKAMAQIAGGRLLFAVDGMDHAYGESIPAQYVDSVGQLGQVLPMLLPALEHLEVPPVGAVTIPKLDLSGALANFSTGDGSFEIPHQMVSALLDQLMQTVENSGVSASSLAKASELLQQLKDSNMGLAIKGTIEDDADSQTVSADLYLVTNGVASDSAVAGLVVRSAENETELAVSARMGGGMNRVAEAALISDPEAPELTFGLDVLGLISFDLGVFVEDGLQKIAIDVEGAGQEGGFELAFGKRDDNDVVSLTVTAPGDRAFEFAIESAMGDDGIRTGTLRVGIDQGDQSFALNGDVAMYIDRDADVSGFTMPADVRSFTQADNAALNGAIQPLIEYIGSHVAIDGAA